MPPLVKANIGDIEMWVRSGPKAAWDIGTSQAVISGDEYGLAPFLKSPLRYRVETVVDIGANIGAFTLTARRMFPQATILAIEPDPENAMVLRENCRGDDLITVCEMAVLGDAAPDLADVEPVHP